MIQKLKAKANIDNVEIDCVGSIEINFEKNRQAYITWQFYNREKLIASKSENIFIGEAKKNDNDLMKLVLKKIEKYRVGRKKIFTNLEIC